MTRRSAILLISTSAPVRDILDATRVGIREAARRLGVPHQVVAGYIEAAGRAQLSTVLRVAEVCGVEVEMSVKKRSPPRIKHLT